MAARGRLAGLEQRDRGIDEESTRPVAVDRNGMDSMESIIFRQE